MGIQVVSTSLENVLLSAPLAANINHKKTAFGASLHAVATLACWSLLYLQLKQAGVEAEIVTTQSTVDYLAPVDCDFQAECNMPEVASWERFMKILRAKGKARLQLSATIECRNQVCVTYQAHFAAIQQKSDRGYF